MRLQRPTIATRTMPQAQIGSTPWPLMLASLLLVTATLLAPTVLAAGAPTEHGAALFAEKCAMCHRVMGMGTVLLSRRRDPATAPLEKRTDLTAEFVMAAARAGLGNMPRISRGEVSDADLAVIAAWLAVPAAAPTPTPAAPPAN